MILYIIRHCRTDFNDQKRCQGTTDLSLNERGRAEAFAVARRFDKIEIEAIYSSPYKRTIETARPIAEARGIEIESDPGLSELDQGDLEGVDMAGMIAKYPDLIKTWFKNPADTEMPGGSETMRDVQARAWPAIESISSRHSRNSRIIVVTHNLTICTIICKILNLPIDEFRRFRLSNGGITTVEFTSWARPVIESMNEISHIELLEPLSIDYT